MIWYRALLEVLTRRRVRRGQLEVCQALEGLLLVREECRSLNWKGVDLSTDYDNLRLNPLRGRGFQELPNKAGNETEWSLHIFSVSPTNKATSERE